MKFKNNLQQASQTADAAMEVSIATHCFLQYHEDWATDHMLQIDFKQLQNHLQFWHFLEHEGGDTDLLNFISK